MIAPFHQVKYIYINSKVAFRDTTNMMTFFFRFLATGSSFKTLAFNFRVGASTVALIVSETVTAIWDELKPVHMPSPTRETFRSASDDFYNLWNFPNCLGAIDGKHVRTRCPSKSGSMFYNYKRYFSIVLQAVVDAHYKFLTINVGGHGKQSDGGTFQASGLYRALVEEKLHIPDPTPLPNSNVVAPFVFIADEAYPLMTHVLKPYSGTNLPLDEDCFNKRLSRCRKTVECAFGILVAKWRLLNKEIETDVLLADRIVKCVCVLHNTIIDKEGMVQNLTEVTVENQGIVWDRVGRPCNDSKTVRDVFKAYFSKYPLQYIQ